MRIHISWDFRRNEERKKIICFALFSICFSGIFINIPKPPPLLPFFLSLVNGKYANLKANKFLFDTFRDDMRRRRKVEVVKLTGEKFFCVILFWFFNWYQTTLICHLVSFYVRESLADNRKDSPRRGREEIVSKHFDEHLAESGQNGLIQIIQFCIKTLMKFFLCVEIKARRK